MSQADLFGGTSPTGPAPYRVKPEHVTNRFVGFLAEMRAVNAWPWPAHEVRKYRETLWPYLLGLLAPHEAERWRAELETEAERLDCGQAQAA